MEYKFIFNDNEYILNEENCDGIFFYDDNEIDGISIDLVLNALNQGEEVNFSTEYFADKCSCNSQEKIGKSYQYLEYHFYVYTRNNEYVINTLSEDYKDTSFNKLFRAGKIDDSYIINVTVCPNCGSYYIGVEQCTV